MQSVLILLLSGVAIATAIPYWWPRLLHHKYHGYMPQIPYNRYPHYHYNGYRYGRYGNEYGSRNNDRNDNYQSKLRYYGKLTGSCEEADDGLYYLDEHTFAFCSNGFKSIQPCADGSANPPLDYFQDGGYYGFNEFCTVNLIVHGYDPYGAEPEHSEDITARVESSDNTIEHENVSYKQKPSYVASVPKKPTYMETNHQMVEEDM